MGYPVMLHVEGRECLLVGGGRVAARKAEGLLDAGAGVTAISPSLDGTLMGRHTAGEITWHEREYARGDVARLRPFVVFAATNQQDVNRAVAEEARSLGILVNVVDGCGESDFSSMTAVHRPPLTVGVATGGASPALARHLKHELERVIGEEYQTLARWLADLRPVVKRQIEAQAERARLWERVIESDVLMQLRRGDEQGARARLEQILTGVNEFHEERE